MVAGGPLAAQFREWAALQIQRIRNVDVTLTAELIERTENQQDIEYLHQYAK